jgi:hypothetical protein
MGSKLEINDTLQITVEQGFPFDIFDLEKHLKKPVTLADVAGKIFEFRDKPDQRIFQLDPVRVFFVQNLNNKWLFWGKIYVQSQTISQKDNSDGSFSWVTSGTYKVIDVYEPDYQKLFTMRESPLGLSYF